MQEKEHELYIARKKELSGASTINHITQADFLMVHSDNKELTSLLERAIELGKKEGQYLATEVLFRTMEKMGFSESVMLKIWAENDKLMDRYKSAYQEFKDIRNENP